MRILKDKRKKAMGSKKHTILYDDREKKPWCNLGPEFILMKRRLITGDYTILGFEDIVRIERKSGVGELLTDVSGKYRETFRKFLSRMQKYPIRYIIVEGSLEDVRVALRKMPKTLLTEDSLFYWVNLIILHYKIPVIFIGNKGKVRRKFLSYFFSMLIEELT